MSIGRKKPGNRFNVSLKDANVASAFRDVGSQLGGASFQVVEITKVYTPPIVFGCRTLPKAVLCGRAKARSGIDYIGTSGVQWRWTGGQLTIIAIDGLTVGESYDINMLVVL